VALSAGNAGAAARGRRSARHERASPAALLLPELKGIEALVVRDFYHRYTVDEHSFLAIEHLHRLKESKSEWDRRFAELQGELEQPELLYLALLLHDSGKAVPSENHVELSLQLTDSCAERLDLDPVDRETVRYLVASHLEMSAAMRRDVFDPANVKSFAERVGVPERLKMLCLMTYADIKAVNPEAMTPWKADNLWQLYIACANYLSRSADERVHTGDGSGVGRVVNPCASAVAGAGGGEEDQPLSGRIAATLSANSRRNRRSGACRNGLPAGTGRRPIESEAGSSLV
jgi:UTP:GlnB (protein PII) uridylyltransferase